MKKILSFVFSVLLIGLISYTSVSAETKSEIEYTYIEIVNIKVLSEEVYCPTTNSWDCHGMHLHKLIRNYKYTLANGKIYYLNSEEVEEYRRTGIIKDNKMRVKVEDPYVEIVDIKYLSEEVYCPTTDSWDCHGMHLHKLIRNYKYTLANGKIYYLNSEEVEEYRRTGIIKDNKMKVR